jgi:hypothetical protein
MKTKLIIALTLALVLSFSIGCRGKKGEETSKSLYSSDGYVYLSVKQLEQLGVYIKDTSVMYNNSIDGVGIIDLVIRDKDYRGNVSGIKQTNLPFYPRYITTLDTVQRAMYMLSGHTAEGNEEAKKWQSFESLLPIIVEQKEDSIVFGETLIFWMTKTAELEKLLGSMQ